MLLAADMSLVYSDSMQGPERERYARKLPSNHGVPSSAEDLETSDLTICTVAIDFHLATILQVLPVTTATVKCTFSTMKLGSIARRVKTHLNIPRAFTFKALTTCPMIL